MNIETKFNHGQRIQAITFGQESYNEKCACCDGVGYFLHNNVKHTCQANGCYNGYVQKPKNKKWYVPNMPMYNFVIQRIGVEIYNPNNEKYSNNRSWVYYMADSSGSMFNEKDCFANKEEAQKECDLRNLQQL